VRSSFNRLAKAETAQYADEDSEEYRIRRGLSGHKTKVSETEYTNEKSAELYASRLLRQRGVPTTTYQVTVNQKASTLDPGDYIRLTYTTRSIDSVVEVLEIQHDPSSGEVELVCGNVRGMDSEPGFFTDDPPSFPSRLGGTITAWDTAWSDDQKQWADENLAFWADDDGYSDSGQDATGHNITVWS
jgi:hypothetical protein